MRFETTPSFDADVRRLKPEHRQEFLRVVRDRFVPACDAWAADPSTSWPSGLRIKNVRGARGVLEMTWSFSSPDGRATFELITSGPLAPLVRWRRVGDHGVFKNP